MEYTSVDEVAVSVTLHRYPCLSISTIKEFDHKKLMEITQVITRNLNKIIDINYYPIPEAKNSNMRHRPIGIGVQGLMDALSWWAILLILFRRRDNWIKISSRPFYFGALTESCAQATKAWSLFFFQRSGPVKVFCNMICGMWLFIPFRDWAGLKKQIKSMESAQFIVASTDADSFYLPDPQQQWMFWAIHPISIPPYTLRWICRSQ